MPSRNNNLPPAIVLPERLVHWSGGVIPGAYGGLMGRNRDPFFIEASPYGDPMWRGAYPEYTFPNQAKKPPKDADARTYQAPNLKLPHGITTGRLNGRLGLLETIDQQRRALERSANVQGYDAQRERVVSMLVDPKVMRSPILWLASRASDGWNGKRFIARLWDESLPSEEAARKCYGIAGVGDRPA